MPLLAQSMHRLLGSTVSGRWSTLTSTERLMIAGEHGRVRRRFSARRLESPGLAWRNREIDPLRDLEPTAASPQQDAALVGRHDESSLTIRGRDRLRSAASASSAACRRPPTSAVHTRTDALGVILPRTASVV